MQDARTEAKNGSINTVVGLEVSVGQHPGRVQLTLPRTNKKKKSFTERWCDLR